MAIPMFLGITVESATVEQAVESSLRHQLQGTCTLGRKQTSSGPLHQHNQTEKIVMKRDICMDVIPTAGGTRRQSAEQ